MSLLTKKPLALLSLLALFLCGVPILSRPLVVEPAEDLALRVAFMLLVAGAPIFNLIKGLTSSPLGRYWRPSLFLSLPSAAAALTALWDSAYPGSNWLGTWFVAQFMALPVIWAIGRTYWEDAQPMSNNSFKGMPLRGTP